VLFTTDFDEMNHTTFFSPQFLNCRFTTALGTVLLKDGEDMREPSQCDYEREAYHGAVLRLKSAVHERLVLEFRGARETTLSLREVLSAVQVASSPSLQNVGIKTIRHDSEVDAWKIVTW
jgi:hypothetical protein